MSSTYPLGAITGEYAHTLLQTEIPQHVHFLKVDATALGTANVATPAAGKSFGRPLASPARAPPRCSTCTAP